MRWCVRFDNTYVIDCNAERSPIIISMRAGEMPPLDYFGISATPADIDVVATFIELLCSDEENACAESPGEPGCDVVLAARRARRCSWSKRSRAAVSARTLVP